VPAADLVPSGDPDIALFVGLMLLGFAVGIGGHLARSTPVIVVGIALVFAATVLLPLLVFGGSAR
jgi:hypothetical protein